MASLLCNDGYKGSQAHLCIASVQSRGPLDPLLAYRLGAMAPCGRWAQGVEVKRMSASRGRAVCRIYRRVGVASEP